MNSLQSSSVKISKTRKNGAKSGESFTCGACNTTYNSYANLFLHIKRKHQGIRPPNTRKFRPVNTPQPVQQPVFSSTAQTGRPSKPTHNIDDLSMTELCIEETQNELLGFLGEKLMVISGFEDKLKLEDIINKILSVSKDSHDKWFGILQDECKTLFDTYGEDMNLDFEEEYKNLDPNNGLRVLTWFLLWLAKHFVKKEFVPDLCIVISKIWKVLEETHLQVQDLDNKLVWKKTMAECKIVASDLSCFRQDDELVYEFIQKCCQLVGKAFENLA